MKIYTKTGDKGKTALYGGTRCNKDDPRVEAYGTVDELNSAIGVVISEVQSSTLEQNKFATGRELKIQSEGIEDILKQIQSDLFTIGAMLAGDRGKLKVKSEKLKVKVRKLEKMIDWMAERLPQQRKFVLPGGSKPAAQLHLARAICRRAERRVVALVNLQLTTDNLQLTTNNLQPILIYLNRLSDFLFTLSRWVNKGVKVKEIEWQEKS